MAQTIFPQAFPVPGLPRDSSLVIFSTDSTATASSDSAWTTLRTEVLDAEMRLRTGKIIALEIAGDFKYDTGGGNVNVRILVNGNVIRTFNNIGVAGTAFTCTAIHYNSQGPQTIVWQMLQTSPAGTFTLSLPTVTARLIE